MNPSSNPLSSAEEVDEDPARAMIGMITGYWITQIVRAAALCSLADHLRAGPMTAAGIAAAERLDARAVFRLLRAAASLGLVLHEGGGHFSTTPLLDTLCRGRPDSLRGLALSLAAPGHWLPWGRIDDVLRTGESQTRAVLGSELFDYFSRTPGEAADFADAMNGFTAVVALEAARAIDLCNVSCVVDVGGSAGAFLIPLLKANPQLHGIAFDLPAVVPSAEKAAADEDFAGRLAVVGGDFFASVPAADLYLLKHILHDWDDECCIRILRNCRRSMNAGGRVAVIELVMGEIGEPGLAPLMDVNMMVLAHGHERTFAEYDALFEAAGLGEVKIKPTSTPMVILEATASPF